MAPCWPGWGTWFSPGAYPWGPRGGGAGGVPDCCAVAAVVALEPGRVGIAGWGVRAATVPLLIAGVAAVAALVCGWPYWVRHPALAALACAMSASLAPTGWVLTFAAASRRTGIAFVLTAFLLSASWFNLRNVGLYPVVGESFHALFFLSWLIGTLLYGNPALDGLLERFFAVTAGLALTVGQALFFLTTAPEPVGYSNDIYWPTLWTTPTVTDVTVKTISLVDVLLAFAFVSILVRRRHRFQGLDRRHGYPMLVAAGFMAIGSALIQVPVNWTEVKLDVLATGMLFQGAFAITVPLALFSSALRARWEEQTVATRLVRLVRSAGHGAVEDGLRTVLQDATLRVWLWLPGEGKYIDRAGRLRLDSVPAGAGWGGESSSAWRPVHVVRSAGGEPLALCEVAAQLAPHANLVAVALDAVGSALRAAQLQAVQLDQARGIQARLLAAEHEGRREVARNLHDGVQQELAALKLDLHRLGRLSATEQARAQAIECAERVDSVIDRIRRIARGVHPPSLTERGLAGALEEDAERLGHRVVLDVPAERLPTQIETLLYYCLTEGMTNALKHAHAQTVTIRVRASAQVVTGEVIDDGVGGACLGPTGGLRGIEDRVGAARGHLHLRSSPIEGTTLKLTLPTPPSEPA